jgi:hypothetical protein
MRQSGSEFQAGEQLDLIRKSVGAQEPGGAHMTDLLRCFLNGPAEEQSGTFPVAP